MFYRPSDTILINLPEVKTIRLVENSQVPELIGSRYDYSIVGEYGDGEIVALHNFNNHVFAKEFYKALVDLIKSTSKNVISYWDVRRMLREYEMK